MPSTLAAMLALYNDNTSGDISAADGRDVISGLYGIDRGTVPVNGDFAWVNQETATITVNTRGHLLLDAPAVTATDLRLRVKTAPATPYTISCRITLTRPDKNYHMGGLCFRESGSAEITLFGFLFDTTPKLAVSYWTDPSTFSSHRQTVGYSSAVRWLRIADNGTDRLYLVSADGETFTQIYSEGRTTDMTANQVGFFIHSYNEAVPNLGAQILIQSWDEG